MSGRGIAARLNVALAWTMTVAVFAFLVGLVAGVPGLASLMEWLAALGG